MTMDAAVDRCSWIGPLLQSFCDLRPVSHSNNQHLSIDGLVAHIHSSALKPRPLQPGRNGKASRLASETLGAQFAKDGVLLAFPWRHCLIQAS